MCHSSFPGWYHTSANNQPDTNPWSPQYTKAKKWRRAWRETCLSWWIQAWSQRFPFVCCSSLCHFLYNNKNYYVCKSHFLLVSNGKLQKSSEVFSCTMSLVWILQKAKPSLHVFLPRQFSYPGTGILDTQNAVLPGFQKSFKSLAVSTYVWSFSDMPQLLQLSFLEDQPTWQLRHHLFAKQGVAKPHHNLQSYALACLCSCETSTAPSVSSQDISKALHYWSKANKWRTIVNHVWCPDLVQFAVWTETEAISI